MGGRIIALIALIALVSSEEQRSDKDQSVLIKWRNKNGDDVFIEEDVSAQPRDKRTIGLLLGGIGDLFGFDVQRRPSAIQSLPVAAPAAVAPGPMLARQQAPPAAAPPAAAPAPAAPAGGIAPPITAPVTLTAGVRRAFQVGVNWANQRQQLGGAAPAPAAPAPAPAAPAPAPAAPAPAAAPQLQGQTRSVQLGLNWQNLRQQLGNPPAAAAPAAGAAAAAPAAPAAAAGPQGQRQSYQIGFDFTNQRQQLGGAPAAAPAAAAPAAAAPAAAIGRPIANLGTPGGRPTPRFPSLLREQPLSPTLVERIYFNKDKPVQKNIYFKNNLNDKFSTSPPFNRIADDAFRITETSSKIYDGPRPRLDTPPGEVEDDYSEEDGREDDGESNDEEEREEAEEVEKRPQKGFEKRPAKVYKVETGDPNEETYVLEEDYTYGDKPKQYKIELPDYSESINNKNNRGVIRIQNNNRNNLNNFLTPSPYTSNRQTHDHINPTPLTLIEELKDEKPIEIEYSDGEFKTVAHNRRVRSILTHQDTTIPYPALLRSYLVDHDSQPAENIVAAKLLNKNIINYYGKKFENDAIAARNAVENPHLINEPHYVLRPEQYQAPYSFSFKDEPAPRRPEIERLLQGNIPESRIEDDGTVANYHQKALHAVKNTFEDLSRNPAPKSWAHYKDPNVQEGLPKKAFKKLVNTINLLGAHPKEKLEQPIDPIEKPNENEDAIKQIKILNLVKDTDDVVKKIDEEITKPLVNKQDEDKDIVNTQEKVLELLKEADDVVDDSEERIQDKFDEEVTGELAQEQEDDNAGEKIKVGNEDVVAPIEQLKENRKQEGEKEIFDYEYFTKPFDFIKDIEKVVYPEVKLGEGENKNTAEDIGDEVEVKKESTDSDEKADQKDEEEPENDDEEPEDDDEEAEDDKKTNESTPKKEEQNSQIEEENEDEGDGVDEAGNEKSVDAEDNDDDDVEEDEPRTEEKNEGDVLKTQKGREDRQQDPPQEKDARNPQEKEDLEKNKDDRELEKVDEESEIDDEEIEKYDEETEKDDEENERDEETKNDGEEIEERDENLKKRTEEAWRKDEETEKDDEKTEKDGEEIEERNEDSKKRTKEARRKEEEIAKLRLEEEKRRKLDENEKLIKDYISEHFELDEVNGINLPKAVKDTERFNKIVKDTTQEDIDKVAYFPHHEYKFKELDTFFGKAFDEHLKQLDQPKAKNQEEKRNEDDEESEEESEEDEEADENDEESEEESEEDEEADENDEDAVEDKEPDSQKTEEEKVQTKEDDEEESDEGNEEEAESKTEQKDEIVPARDLKYPHEEKTKEIYDEFHQKLSKTADGKQETQDTNKLEIVQPILHSGGFEDGRVQLIQNPKKTQPVPYDYDYSGSEKKTVVKLSPLKEIRSILRRSKRSVVDLFDDIHSGRSRRSADGYVWSYQPESYDPSFTYEIPEPNIPDLKLLETKEHKDDDKLSPNAVITENESGRKKTYIRNRKSIGIQVGGEIRNRETFTDTGLDDVDRTYQKNLTNIFDRLKNELEELHAHIEQQQMRF